MASLPPGWTADYDGRRWFFTYGPTGHSQFQFPRPGDEFPDFVLLCCCAGSGADTGGAGAVLPVAEEEVLPEERLEGGRRVSNAGGGGCTGDVVDEVAAVCLGNFAAVSSRGGRGLGGGGGREGGIIRGVGKGGRRDGDGVGITEMTGVVDVSGESSGEQVAGPLAIKGGHSQVDSSSSSHRGSCSTAAISIMSEPVLAVAETTAAVTSSLNQQNEPELATVAQLSPPQLSIPVGPASNSAHTPPWVVPVGVIPELYSESTALCKEEINPPPVELPCDDGDGSGQRVLPSTGFRDIFELPADERPGVSVEMGDGIARLDAEGLAGHYAINSHAEQGKAPGGRIRSHDRAGLPSQVPKMSSEESFDRSSRHQRERSDPGQVSPSRDTGQPTGETGRERRDLDHFPSVLRPGPRRHGQARPRPPVVVPAAPVSNTSHTTATARLPPQQKKPRGQNPREERIETCPVSQEGQPARMPTIPLPRHPAEPQQTIDLMSTTPEARPHPGAGARHAERLPAPVNFVIPIRHMSGGEQPDSSAPDRAAVGGSMEEYQVRASFAPATSPRSSPPPVIAGQATQKGPDNRLPGGKAESLGWHADRFVPAHVVGGRSAPQWSWGWAR